jgi:hypothetical protein
MMASTRLIVNVAGNSRLSLFNQNTGTAIESGLHNTPVCINGPKSTMDTRTSQPNQIVKPEDLLTPRHRILDCLPP